MYQPHPSSELGKHFALRPYQGAEPSSATFLFVGLDANYAVEIEDSPAFESVLDYHRDGVAFWRRHGVHHPFLLPTYRGDGRRYHKAFARIGFTPAHADLVSFVELLAVPTAGRSRLTPDDLDPSHLEMLDSVIRHGKARHVFISDKVARLMRASGAFRWLAKKPSASSPLPALYQDSARTVHAHLHFSVYGKFQRRLDAEAISIASLLPRDG